MTELWVTTDRRDGHTVVVAHGKILFDTRDSLRAALEKPLAEPDPRVVIDLGTVTMCDSSGLQLLVTAHRQATGAGGWLRLADPQPLVRRVLDITGLSGLLPIFDSVGSAVTAGTKG